MPVAKTDNDALNSSSYIAAEGGVSWHWGLPRALLLVCMFPPQGTVFVHTL